ncbi:hypothetical protein [uncultured Parolsenella sp.]|uniref:hypothetical protein n=1 Tax=uncultured Parolsenella sp. TaxID=2083008 RepID=UPI0025FBA235|nr:hypothetical protein [uncultured Parolsenella sp.]
MRSLAPRTIAFYNADKTGSALPGLLLEDFSDALTAYSKLGGTKAPQIIDDPSAADATVSAWYWNGQATPLPSLSDRLDYAIVCCDGTDADTAQLAYSFSENDIALTGSLWAGTLVIMGAEKLAEHMGRPRMGRSRRYASEAIDDLVLALRCGSEYPSAVASPRRPIRLER